MSMAGAVAVSFGLGMIYLLMLAVLAKAWGALREE
jgi:hypothetical protein